MTSIWRDSWSAGRRAALELPHAHDATAQPKPIHGSRRRIDSPVPADRSDVDGRSPRSGTGCKEAVGRAVTLSKVGTGLLRRQPKPRRCPLASTVEIAPSTEADLPLLFGLAKSAYIDVPGWSDERVLEALTHDVTFVAREHGQPAGYVALRQTDSGPIVIEQLFVAPGHEQHGIGHRLLAHAEGYAIAERRHSLQIVVEESNRQARSFYRRSGFVPLEPELFELILPRAD
jgi:GNAT superfamily N-acetyltransferase